MAGKETENRIVTSRCQFSGLLPKHTPSGSLLLLHVAFIGIIWYNFSPIFPKPLLHDFGGKYFYLTTFKEMLENVIPIKTFFFAASAT